MKKYTNHWLTYHKFLPEVEAAKFRESIIAELGCSYTSFFRKLRDPQALSKADKTAIASVYNLPLAFLFPECVNVAA